MRRAALLVALVLAAAACGVPSSPVKQAEDLASIAAEGALLAGDAAAGDTTSQFARTHAGALLKNAEILSEAISQAELRRVAADVVAGLERLESGADDREGALDAQARLDSAAKRAEEIAKAGP